MSSDPHKGGDLSEMAESGTKMPNDAGEYQKISSVPHPTQKAENATFHNNFINAPTLQGAADNTPGMAEGGPGAGASGEVITGTGDRLPGGIESKRLNMQDGAGPAAKGHPRDGKAVGDKGTAFEE